MIYNLNSNCSSIFSYNKVNKIPILNIYCKKEYNSNNYDESNSKVKATLE